MGVKETVRQEYLIFGAPAIGEAEIEEVAAVLRSGWLSTGPRVAQFERDFASYVGGGHPVAVHSCTAALHLCLIAANLEPGDEVITTPMTFCATVNAILHAGATPVLADIDPVTMNLDPEQVAARITPRTRAIVPVHFAGRACDMTALMELVQRHGLIMIEDCAHAIETRYRGQHAGTFGDFGCFSFYVTKNVAMGEGGLVLASRDVDASRIKTLALHGMSKDAWKRFGDNGYMHYDVVECGFKYNMMDLQAALGIHQLAAVEANWERRAEIWARYMEAFAPLPIGIPAPPEPDTRHAYHLFTILVDEEEAGISRDQVIAELHRRRIGVGVHYRSVPEHPYYQQQLGWRPDQFPNAWYIGQRTLSLPLSAKLTDADVQAVIAALTEILMQADMGIAG